MKDIYKVVSKGMSFIQSKLESKVFNIINHRRNGDKIKIKLVAIAKDEAAYLPDWIFHHLHFGFDAIDIYVNNTTDNTHDIAKKLSCCEKVNFLDGNIFFRQNKIAPQIAVYLSAFNASRRQGYSHVVFLDIDEFWMPKDFSTGIHGVFKEVHADVVAFEWLNKLNDIEPFSPVVEHEIVGRRAPQVKVAVCTKLNVTRMNPHNVITSGNYSLADGRPFKRSCVNYSRIDSDELKKPIKDFFILHRMSRSQLEYVAALARGRPVQDNLKQSAFKSNRRGYEHGSGRTHIKFRREVIDEYFFLRRKFIREFDLEKEISVAEKLVKERYQLVLEAISAAPKEEFLVLQKVLQNLSLDDVSVAKTAFCNRHGLSF